MAKNQSAIKARIKSINATKKITNAMNLISNVKLQKERINLEKMTGYSKALQQLVDDVLSSEHEFHHPYLENQGEGRTYYLVLGSDLGMCGSFNVNLAKYVIEKVKPDDLVTLVGTNIYNTLRNEGVNLLHDPISSDAVEDDTIRELSLEALTLYEHGDITKIVVLYTKFVNTVTFTPHEWVVLPYTHEEMEKKYIYLEPEPIEVLETIIPLMVHNAFLYKYVESKTSEHAARRFAMDNATENASELVEKLTLQYNQARQAAITQEITEIVGGADAL